MSTERVGSAGSLDASFENKRRSLEEAHARELDRIAEKRKIDIARAEQEREEALEKIYEKSTDDIESQESSAEKRLARTKQASEERIKQYEEDARKMADGAKRQYMSKAEALSRSARELEAQNVQLQRHHSDQMARLKEQHDETLANNNARMQREAMQVYANQLKGRDALEKQSEVELDLMKKDFDDKKTRTMRDNDRTIRGLEAERDNQSGSLQSQIDSYRRVGSAQINHAREELENQREQMQIDYDNRMHDLTNQNRHDIGRAQVRGRDSVESVKSQYAAEINELRKSYEKQVKDLQTLQNSTLGKVENNAKEQDSLAFRNMQARRQRMTQETDGMIAAQQEQSTKLRQKLETEYRAHAKALTAERENQLQARNAEIQQELVHQNQIGKNQLNQVIAKSSVKLAEHQARENDSFYRLHDAGAKLEESANEYVVRVEIPEHEQSSIRLTHQPGHLSLSGTRRSDAKMNNPEGGTSSTSTYQSYTQAIPITGMPEMKQLRRTYENGTLTFRIPKV